MNFCIEFSKAQVLPLSIIKFKKHIEDLCKKVSYKLHALRRIRGYSTVEKARILANFNYVSLIWMFAGKTLINKICEIHHSTLQGSILF